MKCQLAASQPVELALSEQSSIRRRLRAPKQHGQSLVDPPWTAVPALIDTNIRQRRQSDYDLQGRSLASLADEARGQLVQQAADYTRAYRDVTLPPGTGRVFLAGHQPNLFHPGVWLKNFSLGRLAAAHAAVGINLLIDSDTIKSTSLRVPGGSVAAPVAPAVLYDQPSGEIPYEDRSINDPQTLASFGSRAAEVIEPLVREPFIHEFWPMVVARSRQTSNLGRCLAEARHQVEGQWGLATLEFPQSRVCQLEAFYWFASHLLAQLPRLHEVHNSALSEYRQRYRVRSANHPVPELAIENKWLEAPFWIWTADQPRRRRLFARHRGGQIELTDREGVEIALPLSSDGEAGDAVAVLADLPASGIRLRTRALTTTLLARLLLGDLFMHGIGGGKYDELTDLLISRFFGLKPPAFQVVSATLHLPIDRPEVGIEEVRRVKQHLRELAFHPERYVDLDDPKAGQPRQEACRLIDSKRRWIAAEPGRVNAKARYLAIRDANLGLQPWVGAQRRQLLEKHEKLARELRAEAVLGSREYSFCLYPKKTLQDFLLEFSVVKP